GQSTSRDHDIVFGRQRALASFCVGFIEDDRHQGRSVDCDHFGTITLGRSLWGKPSSSYRKSWLRAADGPGLGLAEARISSISARRASRLAAFLTGTNCTAGWLCQVRTISSPAWARRTSSVSRALASVTEICI